MYLNLITGRPYASPSLGPLCFLALPPSLFLFLSFSRVRTPCDLPWSDPSMSLRVCVNCLRPFLSSLSLLVLGRALSFSVRSQRVW